MVVEITPDGVNNLRWKFYIIWTVLNASFVPIVYFFYPETAGRTLEDIDDYYRNDPSLLVFRDKDVISSKRPEVYKQKEAEEVRRNSSVDPAILRRGSRISIQRNDSGSYGGKTEMGGDSPTEYGHKETD